MTGGRRAPAVAHERAKKQDLGLDASSHFAGWWGLAFIKRPSKKKRGGGGLLSSYPYFTSPELHSFWISSLLKLFSFQRICAASESNAAPGGLQEHTGPAETGGPPVAGWRASSKGWNEKGDTRPLFFLTKKHFQVSKLHYTALVQLCKFQTPRTNNTVTTWGNAAGLWRSSRTSLVAGFHHLVAYLHSPFPFAVASHLPPFRHDSVGREHFRPVEQIKDNLKINKKLLHHM